MKPSTPILSILLVASIGYAAFLQMELNRLETSLASVADEVEQFEEPLPESTLALETNEEPPAELGSAATAFQDLVEAEAGPSREEERAARRQERTQRMLAAFEDPQMRVDMIERQMNRIDSRYAEFFKTLDLPQEDLEILRTLMAEGGVLNWEMRTRGFGASSEEERALLNEERQFQREVLQGEITALLGEEKSAALDDYTESLPYRSQVEALASSLSFTDTPLSDDQSERLVTSIKEVSQSFEYTRDLSDMRGRGVSNLSSEEVATYFKEREEYDSRVLEAASETLSDAQLAAYAERQLAERERNQRQIEYMLENPNTGRGSGPGARGGPRF